MKNIISNVVVLDYPRNDLSKGNGVLIQDEIKKIIDDHLKFVLKFTDADSYYNGNNSSSNSSESNSGVPDHRIAQPYGRSMVTNVKGYMYKSGLITYGGDQEALIKLNKIFSENNEPLHNSELGKDACKYGIAFEILYSSFNDKKLAIPYFKRVSPYQIIPVFDPGIQDKLNACIRYFKIDEKKTKIEVYYDSFVETWIRTKDQDKETFENKGKTPHFFKSVPVVIYENNDDFLPDYEPVKALIDALDFLMSDQMNELSRFANAYLVLVNYRLAKDSKDRNQALEELKKNRTFEVDENGDVRFLTKDIPSEFFTLLRKAILEEIEKHSHIIDFRGENFQAKSGEAMKWALLDMENLCGDKESYFKKGLMARLKLIDRIISINPDTITISFRRNLPVNRLEAVDIVTKLNGIVSMRTLFKLLKDVGVVDDVDEELKQIDEEKTGALNQEMMNIYNKMNQLQQQKDNAGLNNVQNTELQ